MSFTWILIVSVVTAICAVTYAVVMVRLTARVSASSWLERRREEQRWQALARQAQAKATYADCRKGRMRCVELCDCNPGFISSALGRVRWRKAWIKWNRAGEPEPAHPPDAFSQFERK